MQVNGRIVVVTGAAQSLGEGIATRWPSGARVSLLLT